MGDLGSQRDAIGRDPFVESARLQQLAAMTRADLEALQIERLRKQLTRLAANNEYYRRRLRLSGLDVENLRSLADFSRFPTSSKADFLADQTEHPPFGERLGIARRDVALINMTGGTSGQGQEIYGRSQQDVHTLGYLHALPWFLAVVF